MGIFEIYGLLTLTVFILVTSLWALSVPLKDASIIDMFWGPLFVAMVWVLLPAAPEITVKTYVVTLLVTLWGLRLAFHLMTRNLGAGEDKRYQLWRERGGPNWWLTTYYRIYLFQGAIALAVATPIVAAHYAPHQLSWWHFIGAGLWAVGFCWELLADIQLVRFKEAPGNAGKILNTGLWARSRHPNYFGDALQWWGLALFVLLPGTLWVLIGPAVMTAVFMGISNDVLERGMKKRHPGYEEYIARTPKFFPRFSR